MISFGKIRPPIRPSNRRLPRVLRRASTVPADCRGVKLLRLEDVQLAIAKVINDSLDKIMNHNGAEESIRVLAGDPIERRALIQSALGMLRWEFSTLAITETASFGFTFSIWKLDPPKNFFVLHIHRNEQLNYPIVTDQELAYDVVGAEMFKR